MKLHDRVKYRTIMGYVCQFLKCYVEWGGLFQDIKRGITIGSSLSPLLGAFYLTDLDYRMAALDVKSFRYMYDILILSPTLWKLKKAIQVKTSQLRAVTQRTDQRSMVWKASQSAFSLSCSI